MTTDIIDEVLLKAIDAPTIHEKRRRCRGPSDDAQADREARQGHLDHPHPPDHPRSMAGAHACTDHVGRPEPRAAAGRLERGNGEAAARPVGGYIAKYLLLFVGLYGVCLLAWVSSRRRIKPLEEYGSAQWGDARQISKKYAARDPTANLLLTEHFCLGLDGRAHRRNLNVLVVGGSGSGKTRFYAKPNVMQGNTSFVVTDPKGEICRDTGALMKKLGYDVKVIDLINMNDSFGYNPLNYITSDNDVLRLVTNLIRNTTPKGANTNDPFWEKSETALLQALILYLVHEAPEDERSFGMVMELL